MEGTFDSKGDPSHGSIPVTVGWYRKTFELPARDKGKSLWLDFDGVYRNSQVWLNGHFLGRHQSGYTSFRYDISRFANYGGKNVLAVFANPTFEGWWYEGGGIYRHVWLTKADRIHLAPWGTVVTSQLPEPAPGTEPAAADVSVSTTIANDSEKDTLVTLLSQLYDNHNNLVGTMLSSTNIKHGASESLVQQVTISQPCLWSVDSPALYRVVSTVKRADRSIDVAQTSFGIRTLRFDAEKGFFLNGKPVKIQGTCNHQDFAGVGVAVPDTLEYWRVKKLKEMGANAWRMSHNPPTPELLDACDRLGMVVMDENRHLGDSSEIPRRSEAWCCAIAITPALSCGRCATRKAARARRKGHSSSQL